GEPLLRTDEAAGQDRPDVDCAASDAGAAERGDGRGVRPHDDRHPVGSRRRGHRTGRPATFLAWRRELAYKSWRRMPSLRIRAFNVVRFNPRRAAAPLAPPMTPWQSRSASTIYSRS